MEQNKKHEQEMLEQMLKYASVQSLEALYDEYADDTTDDSQPSEQLQNAVAQMLAEARTKEQAAERAQKKAVRRKHMLRRIAAALALVAAIGAVGGVLVMNVEAWRVPFLNFVFEITGEGTKVSFEDDTPQQEATLSADVPIPQYIPEGYVLMESDNSSVKTYMIYENLQGQRLIFSMFDVNSTQFTKFSDGTQKYVDINGVSGYFIQNDDTITLIWGNDAEIYSVSGELEEKEIIKIAKFWV